LSYIGPINFVEARPILLWNPDRGDTRQLGVIPHHRVREDTNRWFFANADATRFLWAQVDRQESDLMMVENIR
jgi:hypothetical protein